MMITAGQLRSRVTIEQPVDTPDNAGGVTRTWAVYVTVWAAVSTSGGREFQAAKQTVPTLTDQVTIRYRGGLTPAMRLRLGSRVLGIHSLSDTDQRHIELVIMCEELVGETA